MTEPQRPADAPSGSPTPEDISARLEALLKRTHAMRAEKATTASSLPVTWPPTAHELDNYDVVDVQDDAQPPAVTVAAAPSDASEFSRPGWSELRLRGVDDDVPRTRAWLPLATALLAIATVSQAGYIWYLHRAGIPAEAAGGLAPVADAGPGTLATAGLAPASAAPATPTPTSAAGSTMAPTSGAPPRTTPPAVAAAGVSATRGAVIIDSTPSGLPVTMEGRERGVTPITIGQLKPGRHDVLVGGLARQVDVAANQVATLRVSRP